MSLTVCTFQNKVAITTIFFFEMFKVECSFWKWNKQICKSFFLFKVIVFEQGSTNSYFLEQDTYHWQSICYQASQRFNMSLRLVYSKPCSPRVIKYIMKVLSSRIYKSLGHFNLLTVKGCSETVFFREWSHQVFDSLYFPK